MPVDGNAIGGLLIELYGSELTMATGVCSSCGNRAYLAEVVVYMGGPGAITRCRVCDAVLMASSRFAASPASTVPGWRRSNHGSRRPSPCSVLRRERAS